MATDLESVDSHQRVPEPQELLAVQVQKALTEILASTPFRSSKQSQQLLRYIVDQTLAGHGEMLKERVIGAEVFGRRPDYDTNSDPIVRARAAELRKRLAQFYVGEGANSAIRIEISLGAYHATFTEPAHKHLTTHIESARLAVEPDSAEHSAYVPTTEEQGERENSKRKRVALIAVLSCALLCSAVGSWFLFRPVVPIELFWKPFVDTSSPVLVYSGANAVYMLSDGFMNRYKATHNLNSLESEGREFVVPISPDMKLSPSDLVAFKNDFLTVGDLSANVGVTSLLATHHKRYDLRCGEDVAFGDMRQSATVLIGAFNNSWTMELTGDLPFTFYHYQDRDLTIHDQANKNQTWTPARNADGTISLDYAVVTRVPHSKTGMPLVTIAGITQLGTRAAGDFIADPEQVKKLVATAPKDWAQKNLQFVLQTRIVNNIPTSATVVAVRYW